MKTLIILALRMTLNAADEDIRDIQRLEREILALINRLIFYNNIPFSDIE